MSVRMRAWLFLGAMVIAAVLAAPGGWLAARAAERAWITTDGTMAYSDGAWVAVGGVRLVQDELEVRADRMRYEVDAGLAHFSGNVRIRGEEGSIDATGFTYDLNARNGRIVEGLGAFEIESTGAPLYVLGDEILFEEGKVQVNNARLTTCEPPRGAGYYLVAKRLDIFPGERVVVRSVRFIESGVTLFYWPYLAIPLDEDRPSRLRFPEIGHNPTDGWYVKFRYGYDGPGSDHGEAALDIFQHTGVGTGVHHVYRDEPDSTGSVTVYHLDGWGDGAREWRLGWDESFPLGRRARVEWRTAYVERRPSPGEVEREGSAALVATHEAGSASSRLEYERQFHLDVGQGYADRLLLRHLSRPLGWNWRLDVDAASRRRSGYDDRAGASYVSVLTRSWGPYTLRIDFDHEVHPSWLAGTIANPSWRSRSRVPEATLSVNVDRLVPLRVPLTVSLGLARLAEELRISGRYEKVQADRASVDFSLRPLSFNLGRLGRVQSSAGLVWHAYSSGERRVVLRADHQYRLPLTQRLTLFAGYSYRQPVGDDAPVPFDAAAYEERVTGRLQYAYARGNLIVSSGYDFAQRRVEDVVGQVTYGRSGFSGVVQAGYSPSLGGMSFAAASVSLGHSDGLRVSATARYDFVEQALDGLSGDLSLAIPGWRLLYAADYDREDGGWRMSDAAVVRDLGCREIGLRFDGLEGAVWLEYRINALPGEGIRLGTTGDRFTFDAESILTLFE